MTAPVVYHFFVAYSHATPPSLHGFGRAVLQRDQPITSAEDIEAVEAAIRRQGGVDSVVLLGWQLLTVEAAPQRRRVEGP